VKENRQSGGIELAGSYVFFCGNVNKNHALGTCFFVPKRTISIITRIEFVSDIMSENYVAYGGFIWLCEYTHNRMLNPTIKIVLRGHWCDIVLDRADDVSSRCDTIWKADSLRN
jgi:hypothetical protein